MVKEIDWGLLYVTTLPNGGSVARETPALVRLFPTIQTKMRAARPLCWYLHDRVYGRHSDADFRDLVPGSTWTR